MRPIVLLTAGLVLGACSSGEQNASTTGDSAMGGVAPAGAGTGATTGGTTGSMGAVDSAAPGSTGAGAGTGGGAGTTGGTGTGGSTGAAGVAAPSGADKGNQSQSGVVDSKTGASTLGPGATSTRPDQNQATTSKGDTVARRTPPR